MAVCGKGYSKFLIWIVETMDRPFFPGWAILSLLESPCLENLRLFQKVLYYGKTE